MSASDHLNPSQFNTYYHATDEHSAESIKKTGLRNGTYMTPHLDVANDYGTHIFKVHVPKSHTFASSPDHYYESDFIPREHQGYVTEEHPNSADRVHMESSKLKIEGPKSMEEWLGNKSGNWRA
jgi:hypothetical protein